MYICISIYTYIYIIITLTLIHRPYSPHHHYYYHHYTIATIINQQTNTSSKKYDAYIYRDKQTAIITMNTYTANIAQCISLIYE